MKKLNIFIILVFAVLILCGSFYDADMMFMKYLFLRSTTPTLMNRLSNGDGDSLFFRLSDETTEHVIFPFPDSTVTTQLTVLGTDNEVTVTTANDTATVELPDDVTIGSDLTVIDNIYQGDSDYHYFGDDNNARQYFDGANLFIDPTVVIQGLDTLQISFAGSGDIYDTGNDITDSSVNLYNAELANSNCLDFNGSDNYISLGKNTINNMLKTESYMKLAMWVRIEDFSNRQYVLYTRFDPSSGAETSGTLLGTLADGSPTLKLVVMLLSGDTYSTVCADTIAINQWTFVEAEADLRNGTQKMWLDGVIQADSAFAYSDTIFGETQDLTPSFNDIIGELIPGITNDFFSGQMSDWQMLKRDGSSYLEFPFAEGSGTSVYDIVSEGTKTVTGTTTNIWSVTQDSCHYNQKYGATLSSGVYIPYGEDTNPISGVGTNYPAGRWLSGVETGIRFNPDGNSDMETAIGTTSATVLYFADIIDYYTGGGSGILKCTKDATTISDIIIYTADPEGLPTANFLAVGKAHTPDAQLSNKSRGITNFTKNLELLNNPGDTLMVVYDGGYVDISDTLHVGTIISDNFPDSLSTLTEIDGTENEIEVTAVSDSQYTVSLPDSVVIEQVDADTIRAGKVKLDSLALLSTPQAGMIEYSNDRFYITNINIQRAIDRTSDVLDSTFTVSNSADTTIIYTGIIGENALMVGNILKLHADGIVTNSNASEDVRVMVWLGNTEVISFKPELGNISDEHWHIDGNMTVRTIGTSGTIAYHLDMLVDEYTMAITGTGTVNTIISENFTVKVCWDAADVGNIFSIYQGWTEWKN